MKFKSPVSEKHVNHACCTQLPSSDSNWNPKVRVRCVNLTAAKPLHSKVSWVPLNLSNPVINSDTCFFNKEANHLEVRDELLDWMLQLSFKLRLSSKTYHLAVYLLDGVFSVYDVEMSKVKLLTYMALHLSAKYKESIEKIPSLSSVEKLFNDEFSFEMLQSAEITILSVFGFGISKRTVLVELEEMLHSGVIFCTDVQSNEQILNIDEALILMSQFFNQAKENLLLNYELYRFHPKIVAASIISIARKSVGFEPWCESLLLSSNLSQQDFEHCVKFLTESNQEQTQREGNLFALSYDELILEGEKTVVQEKEVWGEPQPKERDIKMIARLSMCTTDGVLSFSPS